MQTNSHFECNPIQSVISSIGCLYPYKPDPASMLLRRFSIFTSSSSPRSLSRVCFFASKASTIFDNGNESTSKGTSNSLNDATQTLKGMSPGNHDNVVCLSPLFLHALPHLEDYKIELVDSETWCLSSALTEVWREPDCDLKAKAFRTEAVGEVANHAQLIRDDPDFDEIEDMRIRGNLFYKLDRDSREFEEYSVDFHRRKSSKNKVERRESKKEISNCKLTSKVEKLSKDRDVQIESKKKEISNCKLTSEIEKSSKHKNLRIECKRKDNPIYDFPCASEDLPQNVKSEILAFPIGEMDCSCIGKKVRTPTFNQLTAPYHEPFCLDIYISKGSVRACIIHRATSKVVAVAHSISKDMKFELASTKNAAACSAVGEILAQRALADDIHNVVYTPRKGEKLEGKLQIVLQSIMDNGVNVKVKIKQRRLRKTRHSSTDDGLKGWK